MAGGAAGGGSARGAAAAVGTASGPQRFVTRRAARAATSFFMAFPSLPSERTLSARGDGDSEPSGLLDRVPVLDDAVADVVRDGLLRVEPVVAVEVLLDLLERLARLARVELAALLAQAQELLRGDGDVGGGAADHRARLVQHHARVRHDPAAALLRAEARDR